MNKREELQEQIAKMTMAIQENYPELAQYLKDIPQNASEEELATYYEGLLNQFRSHVAEHQLQNANRKSKDHHL